jgi:hypothetical protein
MPRHERIWFWGLLALAILLRALNFDPFAMHHPDEVLQYIEPAYRLLGNEGIVTWEYRYGMRSWLLIWFLAGPMALGQAVGGDALAGIIGARIAGAAVGLIPVIAAWHLGRRLSPMHGIVAMAATAMWYEQIVFSTHLLTETLATSLFLGAAAIVDKKEGRLRIMAGGALLAVAVILRFHYALAAAIFVLLALGTDWRRWGWLIIGALPVVFFSGTVDMVMGQWPFQWVWTNFQMNVVQGRASWYGVDPPVYYLTALWGQWGLLTLPIVILAIESGKSFRPILFAAVFNLAAHSLIPHKEYRFIELTTAVIIILAAIGSVNMWRAIEQRRGRPLPAVPMLAALLLVWAGASALLGRGRPLDQWHGQRSTGQELAYLAGRDPRVCGIGTMTFEFWQLSRAYIGRDMPILLLDQVRGRNANIAPPGRELESINAVIAPSRAAPLLSGYSLIRCKGPQPFSRCLYVRPGGCRRTPEGYARQVQKVMLEHDI